MAAQALSATEMRIIIVIIGLLVLALIYWFGKPSRKPQGRRVEKRNGERVEPTLGDNESDDHDMAMHSEDPVQSELAVGWHEPAELRGRDHTPGVQLARRASRGKLPGKRPPDQPMERIVSLLIVAREDARPFNGADIIVAAEKTGLAYGDMGIFHRMLEGKHERGPVFSVANMVKPGDFDMTAIETLETPGLNLFMTLPGPIPALDAWDTMLPTARRIAELLDGRVVDEQRNALGRQRVAYIRDDLRAFDRKHQDAL